MDGRIVGRSGISMYHHPTFSLVISADRVGSGANLLRLTINDYPFIFLREMYKHVERLFTDPSLSPFAMLFGSGPYLLSV